MAAFNGRRQSVRQGEARSRRESVPDYASASTMASFDDADRIAGLQANLKRREASPAKGRHGDPAGGPKRKPVKAQAQLPTPVRKPRSSGRDQKAARTTVTTRKAALIGRVARPKRAQRRPTSTDKTSSRQTRRSPSPPRPPPAAASSFPTPSASPRGEEKAAPIEMASTHDGPPSRDSSLLRDPPSNLSDPQALITLPHLKSPNTFASETTMRLPPAPDDQATSFATLDGDVEMAETEEQVDGQRLDETDTDSSTASAEDNIVVKSAVSAVGLSQTDMTADTADANPDEATIVVAYLPRKKQTIRSKIAPPIDGNPVSTDNILPGKRQRKVRRLSGVTFDSVAMVDHISTVENFFSQHHDSDEIEKTQSSRKKRKISNGKTDRQTQPLPKKRKLFKRSAMEQDRAHEVFNELAERLKVHNAAMWADAESRAAQEASRPRRRWSASMSTPDSKIVRLGVGRLALGKIPDTPLSTTSDTRMKETPRKPTSKPMVDRTPKASPQETEAPALPPTPKSPGTDEWRSDIAIDPQQLALSRRLTAREPLGSKPRPQGEPPVWADSRQALCETLPYFKRPQGGCYQNDSHVYGFLFDSVGHCREYLDEDVIICRAGGSMEQDPSGGMVQKKDQSMKEAQVLAIQNDIAHQNPLVVICGNKNSGVKSEMPHQYSVLGWYKPVAVWEERTAGRGRKIWTTIKYRLERLNQAGERLPWHAPLGADLATLKSSANPVHKQRCSNCGKHFDQVYLQGWMCLNSACDQFWMLNGSSAPAGSLGLDYNPDFLLQRAPTWGDESIPPAPVRPPIPDVGNIIGDNLAYINTRGICCPKCGRCNSRRLFDRWVCENPNCDFELRPEYRPVMPTHLHTPWDLAPTLVRNKAEAGVHLTIEHKYGYKVCTYTFDGIDGCFIHAAATKSILSAPSGPDDMMANLQSEDLGLERRVFAGTKMSGRRNLVDDAKASEALPSTMPPSPPEDTQPATQPRQDEEGVKDRRNFEEGDLMTAFSMNYGMPYKFVASGASRSFEESPKAVNDCRYRLNWAARTLLGKTKDELDFNEELIFTYLEGQKIEYHDDGEDGLGPEIASLSLGGRARMYMRMKAKHHFGCSKTGILTEQKPVPGGFKCDARLAAWTELQTLKHTDATAYARRRRELPKELGIFEKRMKKADDLVTVTLSHGDIMVMDGYDIQRYLEHKVVPEGYLRFALTCRTVLEEHLTPEERPGWSVRRDEGRYDGSVGF